MVRLRRHARPGRPRGGGGRARARGDRHGPLPAVHPPAALHARAVRIRRRALPGGGGRVRPRSRSRSTRRSRRPTRSASSRRSPPRSAPPELVTLCYLRLSDNPPVDARRFLPAALAALVAALAGGVIWGLIVKLSDVRDRDRRVGHRLPGRDRGGARRRDRRGLPLQIATVVAALLGILLGKYLGYAWAARRQGSGSAWTSSASSRRR